ncbi:phage tail tip lysozyme [Nocardia brasiliensis]|uniref:phage tail tip lysozyme n=1 Tax=Nocardia brasiliensis TaxID=37326 RepID=UPI002455F059|nr:phage tail tip lysozyme [Nocardia brasiliensis]
MFARQEIPKRSDAPLLNAYLTRVQVVLDGLAEGLGDGSARTMAVADLVHVGPPLLEDGAMIAEYRAQQSEVDRYRAHLGALDRKIADIAEKSAEVTNTAQREVANLYDVVAEIVHGVPQDPTIARQLEAMAGIDRAVGEAEEAVETARTQLADRADNISHPAAADFVAPTSTGTVSSRAAQPRSTVSRAQNAVSYASDGKAPAPIGGSVAEAREMVYRYLRDKYDMPPAQAAAIVANIEQESTFDPDAYSGEEEDSYGLCQWRDRSVDEDGNPVGRLARLEAFAANRPGGIENWQVQVDFIIDELHSTEKDANRHFMAAADAPAAAEAFDRYYERSDGSVRGERMELAGAIALSMRESGSVAV